MSDLDYIGRRPLLAGPAPPQWPRFSNPHLCGLRRWINRQAC